MLFEEGGQVIFTKVFPIGKLECINCNQSGGALYLSCFWHRWVPRITLDRAVLDDPLDEDETDEVRSGAMTMDGGFGDIYTP